METSTQYVPQVGDVVEVVRSSRDPSVGKYYFVGDVGKVLHIDDDGDLYVSFSGRENKKVIGIGEWYVGVENARLVSRPVTDARQPVLSELLGERDALRDELAAAVEQRDRLLDALIEARPYVPDHHGPVQARILAAIASVEQPQSVSNFLADRAPLFRINCGGGNAIKDADGWIKWDEGCFGFGECPVSDDNLVEVKLEGGVTLSGCRPSRLDWGRSDDTGYDIVAYRVLPSEAAK